MNIYKYLVVILLLSSLINTAHAELPEAIPQYNFDTMLEEFRPSRKGTVEITLFKKLQFNAEISELPEPRKSTYLKNLLAQFSGNPNLKASMGMMAKSAKGKQWNVYVLDELVPQINALLHLGDQVSLQAYHAYNSDYGPGLLVYAFERLDPPGFWQHASQQAKTWVRRFYE
jgi:hypothetical protein